MAVLYKNIIKILKNKKIYLHLQKLLFNEIMVQKSVLQDPELLVVIIIRHITYNMTMYYIRIHNNIFVMNSSG